jgi:hypothetical protein
MKEVRRRCGISRRINKNTDKKRLNNITSSKFKNNYRNIQESNNLETILLNTQKILNKIFRSRQK